MSSTTRRWILVALVAVLSIGAIVLTLLALDHVRTRPEAGDVAPVPTFSQPPVEQTPSPTPSETRAAPASFDRSQERFLTVSAGVLWRGTAGQCGDVEPLLERSTDDGQTWTDVTPRYLEIGQLVALTPFADGQAEIIALMGDDCEVQALRTFTQGQFWESYPDVLAASQYVDPAETGSIVTHEGAISAPCDDARSLRATGNLLATTCDGTAYTLDHDAEWFALPPTNVAAVNVAGEEVVVAHASRQCSGFALSGYTSVGDASGDVGCVDVGGTNAPAAITVLREDMLIWSDDTVAVVSR